MSRPRPVGRLAGRRLLVVGASAGIGQATAVAAAAAGARVAGAARRVDLVAAALGPTGLALRCDVRDPDQAAATVQAAVDGLGGLDALVYAAGVARLAPLVELDRDGWSDMLSTNLCGAAAVTAAAVPQLQRAGDGRAVYLSSHTVPRPWPGLAGYAASKAALQTMVDGWRVECPGVAFSWVPVGPTMTEFAAGWDRRRATEYLTRWQQAGLLDLAKVRTADRVAHRVLAVLAARPAPARTRAF